MANIKKKPLKVSAFKSPLPAINFGAGMEALPQLNDALRLASLRDATALAAAGTRAAKRESLRAEALKLPGQAERAKQKLARSAALATTLNRERGRVTPEESTLGKIDPKSGSLRAVGKISDALGKPASNLTVELFGETSRATAKTSSGRDGIFDLSLPVGEQRGDARPNENLFYRVSSGSRLLIQSKSPVANAKADTTVRLRILLPKTHATRPRLRPRPRLSDT